MGLPGIVALEDLYPWLPGELVADDAPPVVPSQSTFDVTNDCEVIFRPAARVAAAEDHRDDEGCLVRPALQEAVGRASGSDG